VASLTKAGKRRKKCAPAANVRKQRNRINDRFFSSKLTPTVKIYAALFCLSSDLCFSGFKYTSVMGSQFLILPPQRLGYLDFAV
jgi:hypothetical protein